MNMVAEGVKTVGSVMKLGEQYSVDLPICGEVNKVITGTITGDHAYRGLFALQPGHEAEPG
jgi:glycerol-3-phosphate dehydrogenase